VVVGVRDVAEPGRIDGDVPGSIELTVPVTRRAVLERERHAGRRQFLPAAALACQHLRGIIRAFIAPIDQAVAIGICITTRCASPKEGAAK